MGLLNYVTLYLILQNDLRGLESQKRLMDGTELHNCEILVSILKYQRQMSSSDILFQNAFSSRRGKER